MPKEDLGKNLNVESIFKPSAELADVTKDLVKLTSNFTKGDHVVVVGGPGNSLDRNSNYCINDDLINISKNSSHTSVKFLGLFERHDRPQFHIFPH